MLDRLMRRSVFAEADGIMRHDMDDALSHQRGQADRRAGNNPENTRNVPE